MIVKTPGKKKINQKMRRVIEESVEKRKKAQSEVNRILNELGELLGDSYVFKKNKNSIKEKFSLFSEKIQELITLQDSEWDNLSNNHYNTIFNSLQSQINKLDAKYSNIQTLLKNFSDLEISLNNLAESIGQGAKISNTNEINDIKARVSPYQYSDFEKRFRGSKEEISKNLKKYIPYFKGSQNVLDIGCGRGEFVSLLKDDGIDAIGIDISDSMLEEAEEKGLKCMKKDALGYLREMKDGSLGGIFASQVIEHFEPEYLKEVIRESFRVLLPGSPLILETINPLSLFALANIYFLDITHQKPLHPEFMRYMLESTGFSKVEILYSDPLEDHFLEEISPDENIARVFNSNVDKLNRVLFTSPDYAAFGIK
ncbi:MAG: methyltransferase domain-containing protein [Candidatus Aminicenantes bacterium]|nr:methyltransferase domain-containing protein [Candidatus Aminicenantes bacterium]